MVKETTTRSALQVARHRRTDLHHLAHELSSAPGRRTGADLSPKSKYLGMKSCVVHHEVRQLVRNIPLPQRQFEFGGSFGRIVVCDASVAVITNSSLSARALR